MQPKPIKETTITDIHADWNRKTVIYNGLTTEQKLEVDTYNAAVFKAFQAGDIEGIRALGENPMMKYIQEK